MSHISTGVEYALHCMLYLTEPPHGVRDASVRDLAELQGVPVDYVAKLFTKLHKAGLVIATEGAKGGFALARPPAQISVLDVVDAIDGDKPIFECREVRARCAVFDEDPPPWATSGVCAIHAVMRNAEKRMREALAGDCLADLATRIVAKAPRGYGPQVVRWLDERSFNKRVARSEQDEG
ncbi:MULTISPECIES: Rrf2 family transcriptional regulator [unclassified Caballeronia]|uniref:RrF2 family transcriptional regulator n=1 Tax=unclassified Caballeronia TaxID=2646786 RepID=UPI002858B33C|nr:MULTISPECIES: Rrf2 family transcriptional regulator [unclassified Caballeronia]MDR5754168.1 Rrf2 family transcriptional regulator [Caballeronia sp. LZ024]MDR5840546.1 Rrf2 family transcriptional regulator [Caballeronia sp. LZ031]